MSRNTTEIQEDIDLVIRIMTNVDNPPDPVQLGNLQTDLQMYTQEMQEAIQDELARIAAAAAVPTTPGQANPAPAINTPFTNTGGAIRSPEDRLKTGTIVISRASRAALDAKSKTRLVDMIKEGLTKQQGFQYVKIEELCKAKESLDNSVIYAADLINIGEQLESKLRETESDTIFNKIYKFGTNGPPSDVIAEYSLFKDWMRLTDDEIITSCNAQTQFNPDNSIDEDLIWTKDTVLNSIADDNLAKVVLSRLSAYKIEDRTGPLTLYIVLTEIAHCDDKTLDRLSKGLSYLKLSRFPNEDVKMHGTVWLAMVNFLEPYDKIPVDWKTLILGQYGKCSVARFRAHFACLDSMNDPRLDTLQTIIREGSKTQRSLESQDLWNPNKKQGAAYQNKQEQTDKKDANKEKKEENADKPFKPKKKTHDKQGRKIDRQPPKKNEPHTRVNKDTNQKEHWCGDKGCGRWGNHLTEGHDEWHAKFKAAMDAKKKQKEQEAESATAANTAQTQTQPTPPQGGPGNPLQMPRNHFFAMRNNQAPPNF